VDATGEREGEERRRQSTVSFSQDLQDFDRIYMTILKNPANPVFTFFVDLLNRTSVLYFATPSSLKGQRRLFHPNHEDPKK
jgi:hypothetical protein